MKKTKYAFELSILGPDSYMQVVSGDIHADSHAEADRFLDMFRTLITSFSQQLPKTEPGPGEVRVEKKDEP